MDRQSVEIIALQTKTISHVWKKKKAVVKFSSYHFDLTYFSIEM